MVLEDPVTQAFDDEFAYDGVIAIQGVPASTVVVKLALRGDHVVHSVIQAPKRQSQSFLVTFGGVIEHHVHDHLESSSMSFSNHVFELPSGASTAVFIARCGVTGHRAEEVDCAVTPEVAAKLSRSRVHTVVFHLVELVTGH